ncbi:hypothetical protein AT15_09425 [Kosmotoga arenicorallina S304]|uniref:Probable 2-phosphosulfolactate phosphatase n=1 Tax=Kosmotoga arenicorallina S304 TaxID=1453497 RepID=A0A176K1Q5_9BACT|nr:hypothetical protein AT15_09425 [Kosmotoga arenicorallina S304]
MDVFLTPGDITDLPDIAIAIDVLRATSSMVVALARGAKAIIPVSALEKARELKAQNPDALLGGERESLKPQDFDLGNSPFDYEQVKGKEIIMTTSNGTKLIERMKKARQLYISSFLNVKSVAEKVIVSGCDAIGIGCAGNRGKLALEDVLCAGALIKNITSTAKKVELTDSAVVALNEYMMLGKELERVLKTVASHGKALVRKGFGKDVAFCAKIDMFSIVPVYIEGKVVRNGL